VWSRSTAGRVKSRGSLDADIIIANAPDPVFVSDLEGKILQANDAGLPAARVSVKDEVLDSPWRASSV